jgi:hypothetical protein
LWLCPVELELYEESFPCEVYLKSVKILL